MTVRLSRRLLQVAVAVGALVPISAGLTGAVIGPAMVGVAHAPIDLDSHYHYLSGLLLAIGLAFWAMIPTIERRTAEFRVLTFLVFVGGLCRLVSLVTAGAPSPPMIAAFGMELGVTPLLCLWQNAIRERSGPL